MGKSRLPFGEISKGLVERVGSLLLAFHALHSPAISTAPSFQRPAAAVQTAPFRRRRTALVSPEIQLPAHKFCYTA